jgi:hypothetical protein
MPKTRPVVPSRDAAMTIVKLAVVIAALALSSCDKSKVAVATPVVDVGQIETTGSAGMDWISSKTLIISRAVDPADPASPLHLFMLDISTHAWTDLGLPSLDGCQRTDYLIPQRLSDGRVGVMRRCIPGELGIPWPTWLIALDPKSMAIEELTPDLSSEGTVRITSYAWKPDLREAILSIGSTICQTLERAGPSGLSRLDLSIAIDGRSFSLLDMADPGAEDCPTTGQADQPAYSPTDATLVFAASVAAIGVGGEARLDAPSALVALDPGTSQPRVILRGVRNATGLRYSPNGACIGLGADIEGSGSGTFVVSVTTGKAVKVSDTGIGAAWSLDGLSIAGSIGVGSAAGGKRWLVVVPASCP